MHASFPPTVSTAAAAAAAAAAATPTATPTSHLIPLAQGRGLLFATTIHLTATISNRRQCASTSSRSSGVEASMEPPPVTTIVATSCAINRRNGTIMSMLALAGAFAFLQTSLSFRQAKSLTHSGIVESEYLDDYALPNPSPVTSSQREHNITEFPQFMLQWPTDPLQPNECDILNTTLPYVYNVTDYPASHPIDQMFDVDHGELNDAWKEENDSRMGALERGAVAPTNRIKTVGCSFTNYNNVHHFPHQMEVIYRCWSLWRHFPHAERLFFIRPKMFRKFFLTSSFSRGMHKVLQANNISIMHQTARSYKDENRHRHQALLMVFVLQNIRFETNRDDDMDNLRQSALPALGLHRYVDQYCGRTDPTEEKHRSMTIHNEEGNDNTRIELPRIVIVNRKTRRQLLGAHNMSSILQDELKLPYKPPVLYFETLSFEEQVEAFNNADILLSPHGAHLTGIPFMQRCSSVIEVFPHGYGGVDYFGSLSAISGVNHTYIYLGMDRIAETKNMSSHKDAETARSASLCAPAHSMVEAVKIQIERWNSCCESQHP